MMTDTTITIDELMDHDTSGRRGLLSRLLELLEPHGVELELIPHTGCVELKAYSFPGELTP